MSFQLCGNVTQYHYSGIVAGTAVASFVKAHFLLKLITRLIFITFLLIFLPLSYHRNPTTSLATFWQKLHDFYLHPILFKNCTHLFLIHSQFCFHNTNQRCINSFFTNYTTFHSFYYTFICSFKIFWH